MRQKGFGLLEAVLAIGVLSTLFITGIFLAKESLGVRKIEDTRASLELLVRSFHAYGRIPTDSNEFLDFLNSVLKTDLDSFGRPYMLILADNVSSDLLNTCSTDSTNLSVRMPHGAVVSNVVAVLLSAGEDGVHDTLGQSYNAPQLIKRQGQISLNENDLFKVVTLTEFKARNCAASTGSNLGNSDISYGRLFVGTVRPSNPMEGYLFYHEVNRTLERYTNGSWVKVDWQRIVQASPEYQLGYLRIENNQLLISPSVGIWYACIPAVGANTIEIMSFDNQNYSRLFWIPPGTTVILRGANHLPIVYTPVVEPAFSGIYWNDFVYGWWTGLRPSGRSITNGSGQFVWGNGRRAGGEAIWSLSFVPFTKFGNNVPEHWAHFTINIRRNQRWLTTTSGSEWYGYVVVNVVGSGTAPADSYWLGTWTGGEYENCECIDWGYDWEGSYCIEYRCDTVDIKFTVPRIALTRKS